MVNGYVRCVIIGGIVGLVLGVAAFTFVTFNISVFLQNDVDGMFARLIVLMGGIFGMWIGFVVCKLIELSHSGPKPLGLLDHYFNKKNRGDKLNL